MTTLRIRQLLALLLCTPLFAATYEPSTIIPPQPAREFRGAWVTSIGENAWFNDTGNNSARQKARLIAIMDSAAKLNLNAIVFQVRPACDAFYASKFEPWSESLSGTMGKAPEPYYDPLEFAVEQAHKRGLELHAWFNPFRASYGSGKSPVAANHVSRTRPDLVRHYGSYLWLDPGERDVQDYTLKVVMDVVRRYDVDGVHFDDYFYPYAVNGSDGKKLDFPDYASWKKYGINSGLSRDNWRRENVNAFIERAYNSVKTAKPWVKFGISPFGIWRPGFPPQIKGKDAYSELYGDARKWLSRGWLDYCAPQLYWPIAQREQSFSALLDWWDNQNIKQRHVWPGLNTVKVARGWQPAEIVNQVRLAARQPVSAGHIHFNMETLMDSPELRAALEHGPYSEHALVPASPWMGKSVTSKPVIVFGSPTTGSLRFTAKPALGDQVSRWVLQLRFNGRWTTEFLSGENFSRILGSLRPELIAVTPVDRYGNAGPPAVLELKEK